MVVDSSVVDIAKNIGIVLRYHRKSQRLTQGQLSEITGVSVNHISNIENGSEMGMSTFLRIAQGIGVAPHEALQVAVRGFHL